MCRSGSIKKGDAPRWFLEYVICFLTSLLPAPVTREQFQIMRASFMLTHRVGEGFDFMRYIELSVGRLCGRAHVCLAGRSVRAL